MRYRTLGDSGLVVSEIALGTMTFGVETSLDDALTQLDLFAEAGGTLIDTADVYGQGQAECIVGEWLRTRTAAVTDRMVVTTKARFPVRPDDPNAQGTSRRHLRRQLDASLRRLACEHIDVYYLHAWDEVTPLEEALTFVDSAVAAGKVGYVGISNFCGWQTQYCVDLALARNFIRPVCNQIQYNLLARQVEWEMVPASRRNGLGLVAWSPLAGGWLTGKYTADATPPASTRMGQELPAWLENMKDAANRGLPGYERRRQVDRTWAVLREVQSIAEDHSLTAAQISLNWVMRRDGVSSAVVGARTPAQLADSLRATAFQLTDPDRGRLDEASAPDRDDYPYGPIGASAIRVQSAYKSDN